MEGLTPAPGRLHTGSRPPLRRCDTVTAARGGKRYGTKKVYSRGRDPYMIEIVECYMRFGGKKHSTSYSIKKHGVAGANAKADAWLTAKRYQAERLAA